MSKLRGLFYVSLLAMTESSSGSSAPGWRREGTRFRCLRTCGRRGCEAIHANTSGICLSAVDTSDVIRPVIQNLLRMTKEGKELDDIIDFYFKQGRIGDSKVVSIDPPSRREGDDDSGQPTVIRSEARLHRVCLIAQGSRSSRPQEFIPR